MSYSGWVQILCKNGHYATADCWDFPKFKESDCGVLWTCPVCGELAVWYNSINTTNGGYCEKWDKESNICEEENDYDVEWARCDEEQLARCKKNCGRIDGYVELEVDKEEETKLCLWCECRKVISQKTYKIPEGKGHKVE